MSKRAVIYARVSTDDQRDNYSVPTQIALCLRHAKDNGYSLVGSLHVNLENGRDAAPGPDTIAAFVDDHSGTELLRPNVATMLTFLRDEGADAVIVLSLDRLARDPYIRQTLEREIEALGARVIYVQGNYAETPEGEIHKDLDGAFAKWENMKRVERMMRGKNGKAQRGLFVAGAPPYGYRLDKQALGGLAVCEDEARVVRHIFEMYTTDKSIREIARTLNDEGLKPARGTHWAKSTVARILRNEAYVGRAYFNRQQTLNIGDGITTPKRRKAVDREPGEAIEIAVTPIIEPAIFNRAKRALDHNREVKRRTAKRFYLLTGMVRCDTCGKLYFAQTDTPDRKHPNDRAQYRHRVAEGHCKNHMISAAILEPPVWAGIVGVLLEPARLAGGIEAALADQSARQAQGRSHLETLRRNLDKLDQRQSGLVRIYADGDITRDEYLKQRAELERERKELNVNVKQTEESLANIATAEDLAELRALAEDIRAMIESDQLSEQDKRQLLLNLNVTVIILDNDTARVEGIFDPFSICLSSKTYLCRRRKPIRFMFDVSLIQA